MTLFEKYIAGETEQVYEDIDALGENAFLVENFQDIENVLTETFQRVAFNLDVIYSELQKNNYLFANHTHRPLSRPVKATKNLLERLDRFVRPFGFIPLSLKKFYEIVGACDFGWDYEVSDQFFWQLADPIQILSLEAVVSEVMEENSIEDLKEIYAEEGFISISLSADYLHKDNISGGPSYALKVTDKPSIDAQFLNEAHNTSFINYLRIYFDNCGFARIQNSESHNEYEEFFKSVKPLLKPI